MLRHLRSRKSIWVALVAACLLVLQAASGVAASPAPIGVDSFGNPLCISDANSGHHGHDEQAPANDHSGKQDCCTLACGMFAHPAIPGRQLYAFDAPSAALVTLPVARDDPDLRQPLEEFQGSPRAPPRKA
ncbi:DUF2946 family protein [Sinorhizobium sp. 6-70]|uniref:DUF2946 family protein n=1 Tax=Sinorhizobium sp. 6-70 TaxID=3049088 RepID=UPI0034E01CE8